MGTVIHNGKINAQCINAEFSYVDFRPAKSNDRFAKRSDRAQQAVVNYPLRLVTYSPSALSQLARKAAAANAGLCTVINPMPLG